MSYRAFCQKHIYHEQWKRKEEEEREPRLPGDKGEEATGHTKQLGTFGTPRCEHRQPQQLNQKEIIFWLNTFILEQKLKIKTTVAFSEKETMNIFLLGIFLKTEAIFGASS